MPSGTQAGTSQPSGGSPMVMVSAGSGAEVPGPSLPAQGECPGARQRHRHDQRRRRDEAPPLRPGRQVAAMVELVFDRVPGIQDPIDVGPYLDRCPAAGEQTGETFLELVHARAFRNLRRPRWIQGPTEPGRHPISRAISCSVRSW